MKNLPCIQGIAQLTFTLNQKSFTLEFNIIYITSGDIPKNY